MGMVRFGELELTEAEADGLSDAAIVDRLVETGVSRLTAARIVELGRRRRSRACAPSQATR